MFSQGEDGALPATARRAKRENGGLGEDPPGSTMTYLTGPSDLDVQPKQGWSSTRDSAPSDAKWLFLTS
jgi:hypothetical protein